MRMTKIFLDVSTAVFLNRFAATHKCTMDYFEVCREILKNRRKFVKTVPFHFFGLVGCAAKCWGWEPLLYSLSVQRHPKIPFSQYRKCDERLKAHLHLPFMHASSTKCRHEVRLSMRDYYFWVKFDHLWRKRNFWGSWGSSKMWLKPITKHNQV